MFQNVSRRVNLSLYVVANFPSYDANSFFAKVAAAVQGGASCVQYRNPGGDLRTNVENVRRLKSMLGEIPVFINTPDPVEVLQESAADGVYLEEPLLYREWLKKRSFFKEAPQNFFWTQAPIALSQGASENKNFEEKPTEPKTDSSITSGIDARKLLGDKVIIGVPVKTLEEVLAVRQIFEIDYVSVKVNASKKTCPKNDQLWGMDGLRTVRALLPHRIVAIGGLNLESASSVYRDLYFDDGIAMAGGIMDAQDPRATAERICLSLKRVRGAR